MAELIPDKEDIDRSIKAAFDSVAVGFESLQQNQLNQMKHGQL